MGISEKDSVTVVRIMIKLSDTLVEFDTLEYLREQKKAKHYKFEIKKRIQEWSNFNEQLSTSLLQLFQTENSQATTDLQRHFRVFSEKIHLGSDEITAMSLIYCKCVSILHDLKTLEYTDLNIHELWNLSYAVVEQFEKQCKFMTKIQDEFGNGLSQIVWGMNTLGEKIMLNEHNEDEKNDSNIADVTVTD